jgi:hypothetical protein
MANRGEINAWKEYYIYNIENTSLAAGTGVTFTDTTIRTDTDADFELIRRSHVATNSRILVQFKDDAYGRLYQNSALDLRDISGAPVSDITVGSAVQHKGILPFTLPRPILIRAATTYTASLSDASGLANSLRMSLHGAKIRPGKAPWNEPWRARPEFDYTTGAVTIAANQTSSVNISINIDAHFLIHKITSTRGGNALITVKDGATDRQWMNTAVHIDNFAGNGHFPNILPAPRFIYKGSVINVTIQDLSGASNTIRLNFHGEKLFL